MNKPTSGKNALLNVMDFSRNGALMQMFVTDACIKFAKAAIEEHSLAVPLPNVEPDDWKQCARALKAEIEHHLNPDIRSNKTNVQLFRGMMGSNGLRGMPEFIVEGCYRFADLVRKDTSPAGAEWSFVSKEAWQRCAEELHRTLQPFCAVVPGVQSADAGEEQAIGAARGDARKMRH